MKLNKIAALLLVAMMTATVFAGCNNDSDSSSAPESSEPEASAPSDETPDPVTIKVMSWDNATMPEFLEAKNAFEAQSDYITVEMMDSTGNDYTEKLNVTLNGGEELDAFFIKDADTSYDLYQRGHLADLSGYISADGFDLSGYNGMDKNLVIDDKQIGLSFRTDQYILFYNKTIFDDAGVDYPSNDMTWTEFKELAEKVTSGEGNDKIYGAYFHNWQALVQNWAVQDGENTIMAEDYSFMKDMYDLVYGMQENGTIVDYGDITSGGLSYTSSFQQGNIAMVPMGSWYLASLNSAIKEGDSKVGADEWDVAVIPHPDGVEAGYTVGSTTALAMNENSQNKDAAWEYIKFTAGPDGAEAISQIGSIPGYNNAQVTENIADVEGMPANVKEVLGAATNISLDRPITANVSEVNSKLGDIHGEIMLSIISVDEGLQKMTEETASLK